MSTCRAVIGSLAGGAVATVLVAWACALWLPEPPILGFRPYRGAWPRPVDASTPRPFQQQVGHVLGVSMMMTTGAGTEQDPSGEHVALVTGGDNATFVTGIAPASRLTSLGQTVYAYGLPFRAIESEIRVVSRPGQASAVSYLGDLGTVPRALVASEHQWRRMPVRPRWPGFLGNVAFYASGLGLVLCIPPVRRWTRRRRGRCPRCAYLLAGLRRCPECGAASCLILLCLLAGCVGPGETVQMEMHASRSAPGSAAARIDALWDFDDPVATEAAFRSLLAESSGDEHELVAQLLTQIARTQSLQRAFDDAHGTLDRVEPMLEHVSPLAGVRCRLERGRTFNSSGQPERARPLFIEAWERARAIGADFYAVDAAHMVAIVEPPGEALRWNERAMEVARSSSDERARNWTGSICNNLGWTYHGQGRCEQALTMFEAALEARQEAGKPREIRIARWCVARCRRSLGEIEEALAAQRALLAEAEAAGEPDGYVHEEIAECLHALGRRDEARPHFARAWRILAADPWLAENEPQWLERLKSLGGVDES